MYIKFYEMISLIWKLYIDLLKGNIKEVQEEITDWKMEIK
jgi:hypothetical protein